MSGVLSHAATASGAGDSAAGFPSVRRSNSAFAANAAANASDARVTEPRYMTSRRLLFSAYCMTGRYDGMCRTNFQPARPSFSAAARAASSTSSGIPASAARSSTCTANALVESSAFSANDVASFADSSWISA